MFTFIRGTSGILFVVYLLAVGWLTMQPQGTTAGWGIEMTAELLTRLGAPEAVNQPARLEVLLNVVMLVPLPILGMLAWPRTNWRDWTAYAFLIAAAIEVTQATMPTRDASWRDMAANTAGSLIGGLFMAFVLWPWRERRSSSAPRRDG